MRAELLAVLVWALALGMLLPTPTHAAPDGSTVPVRIDITLPGVFTVDLQRGQDGEAYYLLRTHDGERRQMTHEQFAAFIEQAYQDRSYLGRLLNISGGAGILWVLLGFGAQALFTGRMVVQWLVSERRGRSVVPPVFWWMSLAGGLMLLVYFVWRRDIVGVTGQATGVLVYSRNLWLLRRRTTL